MKALLVIALAIFLSSCVSMEAPKSFQDKVAYGIAGLAATRNTTAALLERKRISKQDALMVQGLADQARGCLDLASGSKAPAAATLCQAVATGSGVDISTPDGQLQLALDVLTKLETYLATKGTP